LVVERAMLPRTRNWAWISRGLATSRLAAIRRSKLSSSSSMSSKSSASSSEEVFTRGIRPLCFVWDPFLLGLPRRPGLLAGLLVDLSKLRRRFSLKTPWEEVLALLLPCTSISPTLSSPSMRKATTLE